MMSRRAMLLILSWVVPFASAQDAPPGQVLRNYGKEWNALSDARRSSYIDGVVDGVFEAFTQLEFELSSEKRKDFVKKLFLRYDTDALRDVVTKLYSDPGNTYIRFERMLYIARDLLDGKDVEAGLRMARENDRGYYLVK